MKSSIEDNLDQLSIEIKNNWPEIYKEFISNRESCSHKEIYLWLQDKYDNNKKIKQPNELLNDLYYMLR